MDCNGSREGGEGDEQKNEEAKSKECAVVKALHNCCALLSSVDKHSSINRRGCVTFLTLLCLEVTREFFFLIYG